MTAAKQWCLTERLKDLILRGIRVLVDERFPIEHGTTEAITAVHRLFSDESLLDRVRIVHRTETVDGDHLMTRSIGDRSDAGADRLAVQKNCASPALTQTATELRSVQFQVFLQQIQQGSVRVVYVERHRVPVDRHVVSSHTLPASLQLVVFMKTLKPWR